MKSPVYGAMLVLKRCKTGDLEGFGCGVAQSVAGAFAPRLPDIEVSRQLC